MRRRFPVVPVALALVACAPEEPQFGVPNGIIGRTLPKETATGGAGPGGSFPAAYSPTDFKAQKTMKDAHATATVKGGPPPGDAPIDCLTCHVAGGLAGTKIFSFGGRIYAGTTPSPDADVIVLEGTTKLGPVKSDADGYFWLIGAPVKANAKTVVRKDGPEQPMGGALPADTGGGCDSANCHGGTQGKIVH